ncbi:YbaY family lipoprotein [Salinisphaera sp. Q1T1-3]|uniref:YbaY family lipoprotein n=1 Tax=Salinisphaera sp. Q1T1-3 TaxID=2321229 RepID=UPI0013142AF1|nr:YbaY family lipoprotein [Salinisphaera sp. Q1T1-3]
MTRPSIYRRATLACLTLAVLALSACGADEPKQIKLQGQLAPAGQDVTLPDDASARVSLIETNDDADGGDQIVAERTLHGLGQPPVGFTIVVGRALLDRTGDYALSAQILNGDGDVIWQSRSPRDVAVFDQKNTTKLELQPYRMSPDGPFQAFRCSDGFNFQLANNERGALVRLGKRQINLRAAKSLSAGSVRYVDTHKDEIVMGNGVTSIYFDGVSHHDCEPVTAGDNKSGSDQSNEDTKPAEDAPADGQDNGRHDNQGNANGDDNAAPGDA